MAPTICSEKKRQIRSSLKDIRRQSTTSVITATGATATANSSASNSTIINYVAKGSLNARTAATLRMRGISTQPVASGSEPLDEQITQQLHTERVEAIGSKSPTTVTASIKYQQRVLLQISDSSVSSSTHLDGEDNHNDSVLDRQAASIPSSPFTHSSSYQYSETDVDMDADAEAAMETDDDNTETHSIRSGHYSNASKLKGETNTHRQLLRCTDKSVFVAPPLISSNSQEQTGAMERNGNHCKSSSDSHHSSDTYSNMCEIKNTEGLLAIALKTIKLVKRNQLLQRRLAQLQLETSEFIQSVLANPENRHFRGKMQPQPAQMEKLEWKGSQRVAEV